MSIATAAPFHHLAYHGHRMPGEAPCRVNQKIETIWQPSGRLVSLVRGEKTAMAHFTWLWLTAVAARLGITAAGLPAGTPHPVVAQCFGQISVSVAMARP